MELIRNFEKLNKDDAHIAGGKGASLGEMTQFGIKIPPGFVILSSTFDQFLKEVDLIQEIEAILKKVNHKEIHTVDNASEIIQELIKNAVIPKKIAEEIMQQFDKLDCKYVAVRSSATAEDGQDHAWAGQLDSFLNTTEVNLLEKVKSCWSSLFTPRAIFYRFEKGLHDNQISVAVVVQKMVNSEISGIAFSVHPVTEDKNQLIIEAVFGLGEAIVSGQITPDSYVVEKVPKRIIDINIEKKERGLYRIDGGGNRWLQISEPKASLQVLNESQILKLSDIIMEIESHYGFPCDIEWALEANKFYVVQSRPITTLHNMEEFKKNDSNFRLVDNKEKNLFIEELKSIDWAYWLNRPYSIFMATICWEGLREKFFEKFNFNGFAPNDNLYQFPDIYYDKKSLEKGIIFFDNYFKSHKMSDLSDSLDKMHKHHIDDLKKITDDSTKTIQQKTSDMSDLAKDYMPFLWIIPQLEEHFNKRIAMEVPKYIKGDYSKFVGDICVPKKKNIYVLMQDEIISGSSMKNIKNKYGWLKSRDGFTDFYTEKEIEEIKNGLKKVEINEVFIPEKITYLADELKELNFFRTDRTDKFYEFFGIARPLMLQISDYVGVDFKDLADYDANSIIFGQPKKYNKKFSYGLINDRHIISNDILISDFKENKNEQVRGRTAFKGLVRGIAKIVTHSNDIEKVKNGDVLIAQMTFPSFISAMQKAVAFVTDEGSITCHAAIIAREMKKPCIIGTKNATKILKDGDLIEVDANNGIVRIIKRNKFISFI